MDIVECSPRRLLLRSGGRSGALARLAGLGLLIVGLLIVYFTARTASVHCERRGPAGIACAVTEKLLGLIPLERHHIDGVERAVLGYAGDASDPSYRVELSGARGDTPLSRITASRMQCAAFVHRFNAFVAGGLGAADLVQLPDVIAMVLLPVPFAFAVGLLLLGQPRALEIDKARSLLTVRTRSRPTLRLALRDIEEILVEEREHEGQTYASVFLRKHSGERIQLPVEASQADLLRDYLPAG